ncbi:S1 family peptidase, partial [Streptomyces sp. SID2131]|nr:S1 family peptidase [Streptomyces sp. SID2131]
MRPVRHRPLLTGLATVTAVVGLGVLPAHAGPPAPSPTAPVPADVRAAMGRDLGLSAEGVRDRMAAEQAAERVATAVRATVGDRVAGLWFDASDGRLHAA